MTALTKRVWALVAIPDHPDSITVDDIGCGVYSTDQLAMDAAQMGFDAFCEKTGQRTHALNVEDWAQYLTADDRAMYYELKVLDATLQIRPVTLDAGFAFRDYEPE